MIVNTNYIKTLQPEIKKAVELIAIQCRYDIKVLLSGKKKDSVIIGIDKALTGARANFNSGIALNAINKALKIPYFPKNVKYKLTAKGHTIYVEK